MTLAPRLTLYLMRTTLIAIGLVTLVLTGLYFTFQVIREAGDLSGDYGLVAMLWYLIRSLPTGVYDMFPFAVLIGSMIAAGRLASSRELVAMRASGFDRGAIALRLVLAAMTASVAMMAMAEWWMPDLELQARTDREHALNEQVAAAGGRRIWIRDDQTMVRADIVLNDPDLGIRFTNVQMYRLNQGQSPALWLSAATATHSDGRWALKQVQALNLTDARQQSVASMMLPSSINPDVFVAFSTRARLLSMADIRRIAGYLDANGLETSTYQAAFWRRLLYPLNILAMVLVGLPLLFRADRQLTPSSSIFAGVAVGIAFFVVWRMVIGLTAVVPLPMGIIHALPAMVFIALGMWRLRRA